MALYELRDRQREEIHPYLKDILRRNGIEIATIKKEKDGSYTLKVKGHDSPLLEYKDISESQINALSDGGTNFTNKKAYETFASIVAADFEIPKDYNSAQNALSRINIGGNNLPAAVHFISGARVASFWRPLTPLYDKGGHHHLNIPKEGRLPHTGYHFVERAPHYQIPYAKSEKLIPGEIAPNSFGFYYKASSITPKAQNQQEALDELKNLTLQKANLYTGAPIPYKDLISSNVYFSSEKFDKVLSSHGIIIDKESKTMIIHAKGAPTDFSYDLNEEQLLSILSNNVKEHSINKRLELINSIIKDDYKEEITLEDLNSNSLVNLSIRPEVLEELKSKEKKNESYNSSNNISQQKNTFIPEGTAIINGKDLSSLDDSKGWYREGKHGREVEVGNIRVERILVPLLATKEEEKAFSSKIEFLNKKEDFPLISDIRDLEDVKKELEGRSLNFKEGDDSHYFNVFNIEKAIDDKGYTLTSDKGKKIEVTFDKLLGIVSGKEVPLEVKDTDGIFDHYAQASLKERNENSPSLNKAQEKEQATQVKYRMSAVIDGNVISHELTQKQYNKFMALDDLHRMKMFSQIFSEVDMKSNSSLSEKIGAALTASAAFLIAPTLYAEAHLHTRDPIKEIAARNFMELSTLEGQAIHRGL